MSGLFTKLAAQLPKKYLARLIPAIVRHKTKSMSADDALRFLFALNDDLYGLEGVKAIEYGDGVHTKHRHMKYHDFFVERIHQDERVLDVGCGNGALTADICERSGAVVIGIDIEKKNIDQAKAAHAHKCAEYILGDAIAYTPEKQFDAVVLSNVLEHIQDRTRLLMRLVKLTGASRLLIRVPLFERDWRVPLKKELGAEWRLDRTHETEYSEESFSEEMNLAGLTITHREIRWGEIWAEAVPTENA